MQPVYQVLIVEDNLAERKLLERYIEQCPNLQLHGSCETISAAKEHLDDADINIMLVDLHLPDGNGTELIDYAHHFSDQIEIMVVTAHTEIEAIIPALVAGATGYIAKGSGLSNICDRMLDQMRGDAPISPIVLRQVLNHMGNHATCCSQKITTLLTPKEYSVLDLLAKGCSRKEITEQLEISINTVRSHIKNIYQKLSAHSCVEAINNAKKQGIIFTRS
ncbi:MAG: response regulator transcription factor [Zetaproteobacteria bacterium]|nr:response regulator transcription factor [Zetaproteobacteria bacterium]